MEIRGTNMGRQLETLDEIVEEYSVANDSTKKRLYTGLGSIFLLFAFLGILIPGWPTVSWAVPAAFLFSLSNERLFRWTLTNKWFGKTMFDYYATGKTLPIHAKRGIIAVIAGMVSLSSYFVWEVSVRGSGVVMDPSTWDGADPGFGPTTILLVGLIGMWYVGTRVQTRQ